MPLKFSLIICTYKRAKALERLLHSIQEQTLYPDEILIIDGSPDDVTLLLCTEKNYKNLTYFKVDTKDRGLTKQRNIGVAKVTKDAEVVCFLDDDTVLAPDYFKAIMHVFAVEEHVIGVGGVATNENRWQEKNRDILYDPKKYYEFEGYVCKEGQRNVIRNYLGLASPLGPGKMPECSHGKTMGFPLTGKTYEVDLLIGMSMAFRAAVFHNINFSTYFEGYGLYEDADFSISAQQYGKLVITTAAQLEHHHEASGRPNHFKYGKMVVRNGWYVWRIKYPKPSFKARLKWNAITVLLIGLRGFNVITTRNRKAAFNETLGRLFGYFSLFFNKPKLVK
ncbi:glycosyltransferase family 2 protein [Zhouia sp. PK063]|uniref:glycosyltransferase family 2 protein n=1 Tax=Zhouia sp. PK063 TaxID=3373602 RepID=UPI0037A49F60